MKLPIAAALIWTIVPSIAMSAPVQITGRVVNKEGKAVAGAEVAEYWRQDDQGELQALPSAKTDGDGRFKLECDLSLRDQPLLAFDASRRLGGIATIRVNAIDQPLVIELSPLVELRGQFTCTESGQAPDWTNVGMNLISGGAHLAFYRSRDPKFSIKLPAGRYELHGYGSHTDYTRIIKEITLEEGKDLYLGALDLKLTPLGRLYGKELPPWRVTGARGLKKDVTLADFKGKWVVIDFWGFWCGPCVGHSLPSWIDFYHDHASDRDKFEVLAFHDAQATDFGQLDEKLKPIIAGPWHGRPLPFPILLDTTGETIKNFGIRAFPTVLVVDPEGHLVRVPEEQPAENFLASRLTPLPPERRFGRLLDRGMPLGVEDSAKLADQVAFLARVGHIKIQLDAEELKAAQVDGNTPVPLELAANLSYRAWLNLSLSAFGLTYVPEGEGLKVVRRTPSNDALARPTTQQTGANDQVAKALEKPVPFDFHGEPLKKVMAFLQEKTHESFVLDPIARHAGTVKREMTVSGSNDKQPLSIALKALLAPAGMTYVIRDEAVVLTRTP
jgi:thiol-disulfide isomerase/thioredoxin